MRLWAAIIAIGLMLGGLRAAEAKTAPAPDGSPGTAPQIEVTADQTLEWYQDKNMYVARGNAKAVRGDLTVFGDILSAHQRETPKTADGKKPVKDPNAPKQGGDSGDIDRMTAEGHVIILKPNTRITGQHAVDDVDNHVMVVTGDNLRYETDKQVVTSRDTLEYWDEKKIAVARGKAVAVKGDRHVEGDVLTAEFRTPPNGGPDEMYKMTAIGNVTVITKNDVTRGDQAVYDVARDIAIVSGHVRITRGDGTQLTGDVGESDFTNNQSRLLNDGSGRVRALLPAKSTSNAAKPAKTAGGNAGANP